MRIPLVVSAVAAVVLVMQAGGNDDKPVERSPHAAALELVYEKVPERIRAVDRENWWHDTEERGWMVRRPFAPGFIDSTQLFIVTYRIGDKQAASWLVDTRGRTVQDFPAAAGK
jgi:hypothetical protein